MDRLLVPSFIRWTRGRDIIISIDCEGINHPNVIEFEPTKLDIRESLRTYVKLLNPIVIVSKDDEYKDIESCSYLKWYKGLFILLGNMKNAIHSNMRICVGSITNTDLSEKEISILNRLGIKPYKCKKELNKYKCVLRSTLSDCSDIIWRDSIVPDDIPTIYVKPEGYNTDRALMLLSTGNYSSKYMELDNLNMIINNLEIFNLFFVTYQIMVDTKLVHESIPRITNVGTRRVEILRHLKDMTDRVMYPADPIISKNMILPSGLHPSGYERLDENVGDKRSHKAGSGLGPSGVSDKRSDRGDKMFLDKSDDETRLIKKHLIIQYYESKSRKNEFDECLMRNLSNQYIDRVHVLTEKPIDVPGSCEQNNMIVTNIGTRMTWKLVMRYIHNSALASIHKNDICIVANSDIYFDDTLSLIGSLNGIMLSLLRYDEGSLFGTNIKANQYRSSIIHGSSQDVWIFEPPQLRGDLNFCCGGESLCDSKINYIFKDSGYMVLNPAYEIRSHHIHKSNYRSYRNSSLSGPYKIVPSTTLGSISSLTNPKSSSYTPDGRHSNQTIIITYCTEGYTKYTINLFKSMNHPIVVVCPDEKTSSILSKEGIRTKILHPLTGFQTNKQEIFGSEGLRMVTIEKLRSIYHYLSYGYTVIYMDSDIVCLRDFKDGLINTLHDCDILFQNDAEHDKDKGELCTGLVCVKSCEKTLKLFDPRFMFDVKNFRDDQSYLNRRIGYIKSNDPVVPITYKVLKRDMYPNGSVFLAKPSLKDTAMIVHMNHCSGSTKWKNLEKHGLIF